MTKKPKQSKKSAKSSKRTKGQAQSEDDSHHMPATPATASNPGTRSEAAKANYAPPRLHTLKPVLLKAPCCSYNRNLWFLQVL